MTTVQLIARIRKYYRLYGDQNLSGIELRIDLDSDKQTELEKLTMDDGELGVMLENGTWFIPLNELVYKELSKIMKRIYQNIQK